MGSHEEALRSTDLEHCSNPKSPSPSPQPHSKHRRHSTAQSARKQPCQHLHLHLRLRRTCTRATQRAPESSSKKDAVAAPLAATEAQLNDVPLHRRSTSQLQAPPRPSNLHTPVVPPAQPSPSNASKPRGTLGEAAAEHVDAVWAVALQSI
jgi:hypothetical protein